VSAPNKPPPSANLTDVFFLPLPLLRRCRCLFRRLAVASPLLLLFRCFLPCRCFCLAIAFVSRCHPEMVALCATRLGSRYNGPCRGICIFFFLFYVVIPKRAFSRPGEGRKLFSESRDLSSCANSASNVSHESTALSPPRRHSELRRDPVRVATKRMRRISLRVQPKALAQPLTTPPLRLDFSPSGAASLRAFCFRREECAHRTHQFAAPRFCFLLPTPLPWSQLKVPAKVPFAFRLLLDRQNLPILREHQLRAILLPPLRPFFR
jgi:hypothetical protein